jgi:hypothetical protein
LFGEKGQRLEDLHVSELILSKWPCYKIMWMTDSLDVPGRAVAVTPIERQVH